jgi:hypothetical protein
MRTTGSCHPTAQFAWCLTVSFLLWVIPAGSALAEESGGGVGAVTTPAQSSDVDAEADDEPRSGWSVEDWQIHTSVYTKHFDPEPDHVNHQKLLGVEAIMENRWVAGFAWFDNSFGQNSQYLYIGKRWRLLGSELWYFKLTGGLLHGYKEPYEDKIPLNDLGIAPAIVPTLGFRYKFFVTEVNLAGLAAVTITAGIVF